MEKSFLILLATFNGAQFLAEQLDSLDKQSASKISVLVSDDGSTDETMGIPKEWQSRWSKDSFTIIDGP